MLVLLPHTADTCRTYLDDTVSDVAAGIHPWYCPSELATCGIDTALHPDTTPPAAVKSVKDTVALLT